jgi:hypothetical protein
LAGSWGPVLAGGRSGVQDSGGRRGWAGGRVGPAPVGAHEQREERGGGRLCRAGGFLCHLSRNELPPKALRVGEANLERRAIRVVNHDGEAPAVLNDARVQRHEARKYRRVRLDRVPGWGNHCQRVLVPWRGAHLPRRCHARRTDGASRFALRFWGLAQGWLTPKHDIRGCAARRSRDGRCEEWAGRRSRDGRSGAKHQGGWFERDQACRAHFVASRVRRCGGRGVKRSSAPSHKGAMLPRIRPKRKGRVFPRTKANRAFRGCAAGVRARREERGDVRQARAQRGRGRPRAGCFGSVVGAAEKPSEPRRRVAQIGAKKQSEFCGIGAHGALAGGIGAHGALAGNAAAELAERAWRNGGCVAHCTKGTVTLCRQKANEGGAEVRARRRGRGAEERSKTKKQNGGNRFARHEAAGPVRLGSRRVVERPHTFRRAAACLRVPFRMGVARRVLDCCHSAPRRPWPHGAAFHARLLAGRLTSFPAPIAAGLDCFCTGGRPRHARAGGQGVPAPAGPEASCRPVCLCAPAPSSTHCSTR